MSLDSFLAAIGPTGQLIVLLLFGVPAMLLSVSVTSRAAGAPSRPPEKGVGVDR